MPRPRLHLLAALSLDGRLLTGVEETALVVTHFASAQSNPVLSNLGTWKTINPDDQPRPNVQYASISQIEKVINSSKRPLWLLGSSLLHQKLLSQNWVQHLHLLWSPRFCPTPSAPCLCGPFTPARGPRLSYLLRSWHLTPQGAFAHYTRLSSSHLGKVPE